MISGVCPLAMVFPKKQLIEESSIHQSTISDGFWQISLIFGIKFSARGMREFLGTRFKWIVLELNKISGLNRLLSHKGAVFTAKHLAHLNSERLRASVRVRLAHFVWTHPLQRLQLTQSIKPVGLRHLGALQVSLFFIKHRLIAGIPHSGGCQTPH